MKVVKDKGGRVHIPVHFLKEIGLSTRDEVQVCIEHGKICVKKFEREKLRQYSNVGIVRRLDKLDRICIPREYWLLFKVENACMVDIYLKGKTMVILV